MLRIYCIGWMEDLLNAADELFDDKESKALLVIRF